MGKTVMIWLVVTIVVSVVHGHMWPCDYPTSGSGYSQHQNLYVGIRNRFGQLVSPDCQGPLPCYDVVIHHILDGVFAFNDVNKEEEFLEAPSSAGLRRGEVITEGRKAAVFFNDTFGIDFTSMPDDAFLTGRRINEDGVEFKPFTVPDTARYRLYMATTNAGAQFFNKPISRQGWMLNFTRPTSGRGSFTELIPAGTTTEYGYYIYHICGTPKVGNFPQPCNNILNPQDPWAPLVITYKCPKYFQLATEPYLHYPVDCMVEHPVWGEGRGRGISIIRVPEEGILNDQVTLTFPSYK